MFWRKLDDIGPTVFMCLMLGALLTSMVRTTYLKLTTPAQILEAPK